MGWSGAPLQERSRTIDAPRLRGPSQDDPRLAIEGFVRPAVARVDPHVAWPPENVARLGAREGDRGELPWDVVGAPGESDSGLQPGHHRQARAVEAGGPRPSPAVRPAHLSGSVGQHSTSRIRQRGWKRRRKGRDERRRSGGSGGEGGRLVDASGSDQCQGDGEAREGGGAHEEECSSWSPLRKVFRLA
jgi:hypothetical protein